MPKLIVLSVTRGSVCSDTAGYICACECVCVCVCVSGEGAHATFAPRGWKQYALGMYAMNKFNGHVEIEQVCVCVSVPVCMPLSLSVFACPIDMLLSDVDPCRTCALAWSIQVFAILLCVSACLRSALYTSSVAKRVCMCVCVTQVACGSGLELIYEFLASDEPVNRQGMKLGKAAMTLPDGKPKVTHTHTHTHTQPRPVPSAPPCSVRNEP